MFRKLTSVFFFRKSEKNNAKANFKVILKCFFLIHMAPPRVLNQWSHIVALILEIVFRKVRKIT